MVRDSGEVASVDDPATVEFFPCPLGRQGVWMLFAQDPATLVQDIGVAGLRFRSPAAAGRDPGELVTNDYRVRMVFAEDPHAPGKKLTVGGLGLLPLAFLGADPGELVQGGQGPGMLGAKYPAPVAEDRVEDPRASPSRLRSWFAIAHASSWRVSKVRGSSGPRMRTLSSRASW
jgi:hypothetical protein